MMDVDKQALIDSCPKLFSSPNTAVTKYGLECGEGWLDILSKLCRELESVNEHRDEDQWVKAEQIKSKFGGLRFYTNDTRRLGLRVLNLIKDAEVACSNTCEKCGASGTLRKDVGWWMVMCESHYDEKKEGK
jgi:hypothetical protein